ncbi:MAG TPA: DUF6171 family protein [Gemmataceae bacterium]|nr:DUF6171 family protein [Gemmataceae bacterium]
MPAQGCPRRAAEQALAAARTAGDRRREASALADLGIMHLYEGEAPQAVALLDDALAITREIGDRSAEGDALGHLGLAAAAAGQPQRGLTLLEQELRSARNSGFRLAEKSALAHLGLTHSRLRDPPRAIALFAQALPIARDVGDWQHEAELLWYLAIQHAALGQRDEAIARADAAVALLERMGKPQAAWFARHLQAYRSAESGAGIGSASAQASVPPETLQGGVFLPGAWERQLAPPRSAAPPVTGPRLLDMALSAATALAKFLGSGLKTVAAETREKRLQTCAACVYHTGLRCRVCGCFTGAKAALAHEECPIGKWPA